MFRRLLTFLVMGACALAVRPAGSQEIPRLPDPDLLPPPRTLTPPESPPPAPAALPVAPDLPSVAVAPGCTHATERHFSIHTFRLVEEQTLREAPAAALREVITSVPVADVEVTYRAEKRTAVVMVLKAREEDQLVTTMSTVPETVVCTETGHPRTEYRQVPVCKVVKVQVFDRVPETRTYTIKVPVVRPVEREVLFRSYVVDLTPQPAVFRSFRLIDIPNEASVPVPAAPPCGVPHHPLWSPLPEAPAGERPVPPEAPPPAGGPARLP